MERLRRSQPFDGYDLVTFVHDREREARVDPAAVDQHRAGAALSVVAALFGTRQVEMFAQRVEQRRTRVQVEVPHTTVDGQCDLCLVRRDLGVLRIDNGEYAQGELTFLSG